MTKFTDWRIYNGGGQPYETVGRKVQAQTAEETRLVAEISEPQDGWGWDVPRDYMSAIVAYRMVEEPHYYWLVVADGGDLHAPFTDQAIAVRTAASVRGTVLRLIAAPEENGE